MITNMEPEMNKINRMKIYWEEIEYCFKCRKFNDGNKKYIAIHVRTTNGSWADENVYQYI